MNNQLITLPIATDVSCITLLPQTVGGGGVLKLRLRSSGSTLGISWPVRDYFSPKWRWLPWWSSDINVKKKREVFLTCSEIGQAKLYMRGQKFSKTTQSNPTQWHSRSRKCQPCTQSSSVSGPDRSSHAPWDGPENARFCHFYSVFSCLFKRMVSSYTNWCFCTGQAHELVHDYARIKILYGTNMASLTTLASLSTKYESPKLILKRIWSGRL